LCEHVFVRWDNLKVDAEESRTLPGYREPATVRTFDAPEALDTRFYEIRAKSALNRVPNASRMPFRWTINPYRGCSHACVYCSSGETPILMANGGVKPLAELTPGDLIYGTRRGGTYRHYATTRVLAHWRSVKRAFRITLEDGTELVASGDHRFLTDRGWKHVTGREQGSLRRPHLTLQNKLMGTGRFAAGPRQSSEYEAGYLAGMIRGDGALGFYSYDRPGRRHGNVARFRLALTDLDGLRRTRDYLAELEVSTQEFEFQAATKYRRGVTAIRTQAWDKVALIQDAIRWPTWPGEDWIRGFLAGIFDAEGSCSEGVFRIPNTDPEIIDWTTRGLARFGFHFVIEDARRQNTMKVIRLLGGLPEQLRFFHLTDPAIRRKRSIEEKAIKTATRLRVVEIEPLGEMELFDITTGTGDFIANGVVSHNCFARPTHTYLDFNAGRDFEKEIVVKVNVPEVARAELMRPSWKREHVALGTNTDPYQWVEGRYKLMPGIWEAMRDSRTPSSVLTKSPLLLRDVDLMKEIHEAAGFAANLSIPTLDERAWRASEPHTPHPRKRIEAVAELNRQGIPCGVLIAPLMPGINDAPEQVEEILELCGEAGAVNIGGICLHLRGEVRQIFMEWLASYRPDLVPRYERLYARGAYAPKAERDRIAALARPGRRAGPARRGGAAAEGARPDPGGGSDPVLTPSPRPRREPVQDSLF
jgi:DNA repair photolyase